MPKVKTGPDKFGIEHEIKNEKGQKGMSDEEVRKKAEVFTNKSDT